MAEFMHEKIYATDNGLFSKWQNHGLNNDQRVNKKRKWRKTAYQTILVFDT